MRVLHVPREAANFRRCAQWVRLEDACEGVFDCPHSTPDLRSDGPFVVRSQDIRGGVFRSHSAGRVSERIYRERIERAEPKHGDVLYSREGTYFGIAAEVPPGTRVCLGQRMVLIRPNSRFLDYRYLRFWLNSPIMARHIHGFRDGTVAERLNMPTIRNLPIPLLPMPEQKAIAHILGTLDDKIEVNRRMGVTLEAMARALFKSWFVDFDPVRAKSQGRDPGLPPHLAALFPARLVETEQGEIPEGWRWWRLDELATQHRAALSPGAEPDRMFEHYSIPAYDSGQGAALDHGEAIKSNKTIVPDDAILLSKLNPEINRVWLPKKLSAHPKVASTEFLCFTPKAPVGRALLFCTFRSEPFRRQLEGMVTGTSKSHQRVSPDAVLRVLICPARSEGIEAFEAQAWPLLDRTIACREESRKLSTLRDALLPKLISGEIRVRDAERALADASV